MNRKKFLPLAIFLISIYLFSFSTSFAADITIVGCETSDHAIPCNLCEAFKMASRAMRFALYVIIPGMSAFAFMLAGGFLLFAAGNEGRVKTGQEIIKVTIYGILIAFGGWIIINTIMVEMVNPNVFNWWQVWYQIPQCAEEGTPNIPAVTAPYVAVPPSITTGYQVFGTLDSESGLKALNDKGISIIDSNGRTNTPCQQLGVTTGCTETAGLLPETVDNLANIKNNCSSGELPVSGLQETAGHSTNTNHGNGATADIAITNPVFLNCIIQHKREFNISRIGCGQGRALPGCDFQDKPTHVHVEFKI